MTHLQKRIDAFVSLGKFLGQFGSSEFKKASDFSADEGFYDEMLQTIHKASVVNSWFTEKQQMFAFQSWSQALSLTNLQRWISSYSFPSNESPKTIAIIMAGNIPLVGLHDFISALITGHHVLVKLSSNDTVLLPFISRYLIAIEPSFSDKISFTEDRMNGFDAVIATGSNNTARYFEYYFGKYPHIIRKNRNSIAILTGKETEEQMNLLSDDIFRYFGLGCRNVSKIYVPENYQWDHFFGGMFRWKEVINNHKYMNNYDYNKAVYLMSEIPLLDNEFMILKEDQGFSSPISVVFYETYKDLEELQDSLTKEQEHIQCIVSDNHIAFGEAQHPELWDYADNVDTIEFLLELHS